MRTLVLIICTGLLLLSQSTWAKMAIANMNYDNAWESYTTSLQNAEPKQQFPYQACFDKSAKKHDLPVTLLLALARGESDFNPTIRSSANAYGVMQIVWPATAQDLGIYSLKELKKPCVNIDAGARYIKTQIDRFDGSIHLALAAYNYGPSRIARTRENIPEGANWYSGYIYQHLQYVLGTNQKPNQSPPPLNYSDEGKLRITTFNQPYRVQAFIAAIQQRAPRVRLDAFDNGMGRYHVMLLYGSRRELKASKKALQKAGFNMGLLK